MLAGGVFHISESAKHWRAQFSRQTIKSWIVSAMIDRSELKGIDVHELAKTLRPLVSHASSAYRYVTSSVAIAVDKEAVAIWRDFSRVCGATGVRNAEGDFGAAWIFECSEKFPSQLL